MLLSFLNKFFFVFHSILILFNLFGWTWRKTRKLNLIGLSLTVFSWFILGIWYGFGFCPSTEWHWQIRRELGYYDMESSYIKFLINSFTGVEVNGMLVDIFTVVFLLMALSASILTNMRDFREKKIVRR